MLDGAGPRRSVVLAILPACRRTGFEDMEAEIFDMNVEAGERGRDQRRALGGGPVMSTAGVEPPRILVVDDDPVTNRMVVDYLENRNMRGISACERREMDGAWRIKHESRGLWMIPEAKTIASATPSYGFHQAKCRPRSARGRRAGPRQDSGL